MRNAFRGHFDEVMSFTCARSCAKEFHENVMTSLKTTCWARSLQLQRLVRVALLVLFLGQLLTDCVRI